MKTLHIVRWYFLYENLAGYLSLNEWGGYEGKERGDEPSSLPNAERPVFTFKCKTMYRTGVSSNCAHQWAHQHSTMGHNGNLFFVENVIYSYGSHFPIASLYGRKVFFTLKNYSRTTSKHKHSVRSACSHLEIVYTHVVPVTESQLQSTYWQQQNINIWSELINQISSEFALHPKRTSLISKLQEQVYQLQSFVAACNIDPHGELASILNILTNEDVKNSVSQYMESRKNALEYKKAKAIKVFQKELRCWQNGETRELHVPEIAFSPNCAFLRLRDGIIETSKKVNVTMKEAKVLWALIKDVLSSRNEIDGFTFRGYIIQKINRDEIIIGCHTIAMKHVKSIIKKLGWE